MAAESLVLNLSEKSYKSNNDSSGTSDVDSKMTPVKAKTLDEDYDPSGSKYEEATLPHKPNIYDDAANEIIPNTVPPSSTKKNTKNVLPPNKVKKSKIGKPKLSDTPEPTKKAIHSSISTPPPANK